MKRHVLAIVFAAVLGVSALGAAPANAAPVSGSSTTSTARTVHSDGFIGAICSLAPSWCN